MANGLNAKPRPETPLTEPEKPSNTSASTLSLASDIVELLVFTTDDAFLQTLREALGSSRRLWHVPAADKIGDLMLAGQVGILVLDARALHETPSVFMAQIKRQFPDLVVVVAGSRDDETSLAPLISSGVVYRFIHKPLSPGRAKSFADAAVRRYGEQRRRIAAVPDAARALPWWVIGAAATLAMIVMAVWHLKTGGQTRTPVSVEPASSPSIAPAPETHRNPAAESNRIDYLISQSDKLHGRGNAATLPRPKEARPPGSPGGDGMAEPSRLAATVASGTPPTAATPTDPTPSASTPGVPSAPASSPGVAALPGSLPVTSSTPGSPPRSVSTAAQGSAADVGGSGRFGAAPDDLVLVRTVRPPYPLRAARSQTEGWVELDFTVTETGEVKDITVHAANPPGVFDAAAVDALAHWLYKPVVRNGQPATPRARVRMRFTLKN